MPNIFDAAANGDIDEIQRYLIAGADVIPFPEFNLVN